ncbi:receptor-like protein EIX2 [Triticum dicoccoides]|uniref:receptor-like protein EIX2 n=1 Tax=Triticum dicoccoides TaxID=85692 RepID=UPI001891CDBF|nr:receptor-like protein EIX2 [Triticum dicoccoides]
MHPPPKPLLLLAVLLAASPHALAEQPPAAAACPPQERDALLAFKQGITISSDAAGLLASWREDDCCRWRGVRCSNRTGHVVALNLRGQGLAGEISPSLLSLPHLEHLDLSSNRLVGPAGSIPEFLGSMGNLRYLDLSGAPYSGEAPFSGQVPPHLGNLSKLQHLDLSSNRNVSSNDLSWLTRLPFLRFLGLNFVDLSMAADWAHAVNALPLRSLHLEDCSLTSANQSLPHSNLTTTLEVLDLALNNFDQPVASCWFWNLTRLKRLYLEVNNGALYGPLPDALGGMVRLQELSFGESGSHMMSMGSADLKNLCNLKFLDLDFCFSNGFEAERLPQCSSDKLQELHLMGNQLTGTLADWMGHRTSLVILDLSSNNITGPIPESIGRFTDLRVLDLWNNNLTGHVPPAIGTLTNLASLVLGQNHLDGLIAEGHFHGLKSLEQIYLSDNQLEIVVGSEWVPPFRLQEASFASCQIGHLFPAWLKWQVGLTRLDISSTGITDRFPDWFSSSFSKITYLDISNNRISGALPKNMGNMSLVSLYSSSNNISGRIPQLPRNLEILDISRNSLSGPLPSDFGAPKLSTISLFSNYITGQIPVFVCELYLYSLDLANNILEGELPQCFSTKHMTFLLLSNNSFSGNFPPFLENCTALSFLDLARNRFSGTLPMWIGNLGKLQFLRLSNNMFHGHIPDNITSLSKLYHLNLAANGISGSIPHHLSNLTMMTTPYVHVPGTVVADFQIMVGDMPVVFKRQELKYRGVGVLEILSIDFSCNYLTGKIPEEITSLGGLINLNLSWNQLNGGLPKKIGDMQTLESLDFSNNDISGEIPSSLSNLTYLSILDLSYNHLAGIIPSGVQLDTLYTEYPSIYNGNPGLCGPILHKSCSVNNNAPQPDHQQSGKVSESTLFFYFGLGSGFMAGLWVVFCALLFKKAWRISYFCFFDKVHDKAYVFIVVTWGRFARKR